MNQLNNNLKVIQDTDQVSIVFRTFFIKSCGNTYYNAGDMQSIDEVLAECGYKLREASNYLEKRDEINKISITVVDQ